MGADNVLHILPNRGLDQSILLAILIGLLVLLFLTETLGWVFVGLVVPGYLSSVLVAQPSMGIATIIEAIVTFILARFLSDILANTTIWSPFFGRERFFIIVLLSVVVRQNSQVWILPEVLEQIDHYFGTDYRFDTSQFNSIGLVLVPLIANMFWKITLGRGLIQIGIPVLITYAVLSYVLLPFTNLSFSNAEITYDNVALNFLNTPKAYVIMLLGAILAARYNVLYGWDYNGILVPSLLSLGWLEPISIPLTIVEVFVLFGATKLFLANPMLRTINLEGPRQVALVFTMSFLVKYIFAWIVTTRWPHVNVINLFGYGYVVTSLITVKMLQKKAIARILLPTLQVSFGAFVIGSLVGFGLEQIAPKAKPLPPLAGEQPAVTQTMLRTPLGAMAVATVRARTSPLPADRQGRDGKALERYAHLFGLIDEWLVDGSPAGARTVEVAARPLGLTLHELGDGTAGRRRAFVLLEREERLEQQTGWDMAVLVPGAPGPILEVPRPRTEPAVAELAAVLCEHLECRAILVAGIDSADGGRTAGDALTHASSTFALASRHLGSAPVVQVRVSADVPESTAHLHLHHKLPESIRLDRMWPAAAEVDIELDWAAPPGPNQTWPERKDMVVLFVHPDAVWQVLIEHARRVAPPPPRYVGVSMVAWLRETFADESTLTASQTMPSQSEVRFVGHMLAARMLEMRPGRLPWLSYLAGLVDYHIVELDDCVDAAACWVLTERSRPVKHRWGTLAVRTEPPLEPLAVEAPRPLIESGAWQIAAEMWKQSHARMLIVGHDLPVTHGAPRLDPVRYANVATPFHAMHESVHRALRRDAPGADPLIIQVRGFATWRQISGHVIVGLGPPAIEARQTPPALLRMMATDGFLGWLGDDTEFARGEPEYITLAGQGNPQLAFTHSAGGVDMALVWFSQPVRQLYLDDSVESVSRRLEGAGFALTPRSALGFLTTPPPAIPDAASQAATPRAGTPRAARPPAAPPVTFDELLALAVQYARTQDIAVLGRMRALAATDRRVQVSASWSTEISLPLLAVSVDSATEVARAVILLSEFADDCADLATSTPSREQLKSALIRRCRSISYRHPRTGR